MDYEISTAYHELIETRSALETLHHDLTGDWPRNTDTPRDIADRIRAKVNKERETAREHEQRALL
jgi:hypothetical protein